MREKENVLIFGGISNLPNSMSKNYFIEKFNSKSSEELKKIISDKIMFSEDARNAAIHLLLKRNEIDDEIESAILEKKKNAELNKENLEKIKAENELYSETTNDPNAPKLYSKTLIYILAAAFTTIYGSVLLFYNFKELKNKKGQNISLIFGILYTIIGIVAANFIEFRNTTLYINLLGAGINLFIWEKLIGKIKYQKRSWVKPTVISIIIAIPLIVAAIYSRE